MVLDMKDIGKMIYSMVMVKRSGQITHVMRVNTLRVRNMVKERMYGQMGHSMLVIGSKIGLRDMEHIHGLMEDNILGHGKIIICMDMVSTLGRMDVAMKGSMRWIRNMALVCINGLMDVDMRVIGLMGSNMDRGNIYYLMEVLRLDCGKVERELNGLMNMLMITLCIDILDSNDNNI